MDNPATIRHRKPRKDCVVPEEVVLDMLAKGMSIPQIAKKVGVGHSRLYVRMLHDRNVHRYVELQSAKSLAMLDKAETEVENATDPHTLARGRETARLAQWRLERLMRKLYGQDQPAAAPAVAITICIGSGSFSQTAQDAAQDIGSLGQVIDNAE